MASMELVPALGQAQLTWVEDVAKKSGAWKAGLRSPRQLASRKYEVRAGERVIFELAGCEPLRYNYSVTGAAPFEDLPILSIGLVHLMPLLPPWKQELFTGELAEAAANVAKAAGLVAKLREDQAKFEDMTSPSPSTSAALGPLRQDVADVRRDFTANLNELKSKLTSLKNTVYRDATGSAARTTDPRISFALQQMTDWVTESEAQFAPAILELDARLKELERQSVRRYMIHTVNRPTSVYVDVMARSNQLVLTPYVSPTLVLQPPKRDQPFELTLFANRLRSDGNTIPNEGLGLTWNRPLGAGETLSRFGTAIGVAVTINGKLQELAGITFHITDTLGLTLGLTGGTGGRKILETIRPSSLTQHYDVVPYVGMSIKL